VGSEVTLAAPEPLKQHHQISGFDCGVPSLDDWLKRRALANQASGASRTFVVCQDADVVGYYALASSAISTDIASGRFRRNMPEPVPVVMLGRLAVIQSLQGKGLGRALFYDAAHRVIQAADSIGVRGLLVHALSDEAKTFYLKLGFDPSPLEDMTLMITLTDLRAAVDVVHLREAESVIAAAEVVTLSERDSLRVLNPLERPPAPNAQLRAAIAAMPKPKKV
jgi:predicted N-acetyltransferase YhbS